MFDALKVSKRVGLTFSLSGSIQCVCFLAFSFPCVHSDGLGLVWGSWVQAHLAMCLSERFGLLWVPKSKKFYLIQLVWLSVSGSQASARAISTWLVCLSRLAEVSTFFGAFLVPKSSSWRAGISLRTCPSCQNLMRQRERENLLPCSNCNLNAFIEVAFGSQQKWTRFLRCVNHNSGPQIYSCPTRNQSSQAGRKLRLERHRKLIWIGNRSASQWIGSNGESNGSSTVFEISLPSVDLGSSQSGLVRGNSL